MPQNRKNGTNPPIWVSQNFLTSYKIIDRIIRRTSLNRDEHVIEIGPGKGHITSILGQKCRKVSAIEIDDIMGSAVCFPASKEPEHSVKQACQTMMLPLRKFFMCNGFAFFDVTGNMC